MRFWGSALFFFIPPPQSRAEVAEAARRAKEKATRKRGKRASARKRGGTA
jgi:hypothetical protein